MRDLEPGFGRIAPDDIKRGFGGQHKDDVMIDVEVSTAEGFCGKHPGVWLFKPAIDSFNSELEALEATRAGSATLSATPQSEHNALELRVLAADHGQTMLVEIKLQKVAYAPDGRLHPFSISAHFAFDPAMLQKVVADFRDLLRV